jgi:hypothetical protein
LELSKNYSEAAGRGKNQEAEEQTDTGSNRWKLEPARTKWGSKRRQMHFCWVDNMGYKNELRKMNLGRFVQVEHHMTDHVSQT